MLAHEPSGVAARWGAALVGGGGFGGTRTAVEGGAAALSRGPLLTVTVGATSCRSATSTSTSSPGSTAAARLGGSDGAAYADPETARFGYREIRYEWRAHGVNPTCKELYLHDDEFARLFGMGKAAFYAQRQWQQRDAKQKLHLF